MGGMKENLFLSSFVDYDRWNVDYRELIGGFFDDTFELLYAFYIRYNDSNAVDNCP